MSFLNLFVVLFIAFVPTINPFYCSLPSNHTTLSTPVMPDIYPSHIEGWGFTGTYSAYQPKSAHSLSTVPSVTSREHESPAVTSTIPLPSLWSIIPTQATKLNPDTLASTISLSPQMQHTPYFPWSLGPCVFAIFAVLRAIASAIPALSSAGLYWTLVWHYMRYSSCYVVQRTLLFVWQRVLQCPATVRLEDYLLLDHQFTAVSRQLVSTQVELVGTTEKNDRTISLLSSDLANAEMSIKQLETKIESLVGTMSDCNATITVMETDLLDVRGQLDATSADHATTMARLSLDFTEQSALANELIAELEERELEVGTITEKNQVLEQELVLTKAQLAEKNTLITAYIQQKSEDDRAIAELQTNERDLEQELGEFEQSWDNLVAQLDNVVAEKKYLEAEYQALCDEVDGSCIPEWPAEEQECAPPQTARPTERLVEIDDGVYDFVTDDYEPDGELRFVLGWSPSPLVSADAAPPTVSDIDTADGLEKVGEMVQPSSHEQEHCAHQAQEAHPQDQTSSEETEERVIPPELPTTGAAALCNAEVAEYESITCAAPPFNEGAAAIGQDQDHPHQSEEEACVIQDVVDTSLSVSSIALSESYESKNGSDQLDGTEVHSEASVGGTAPSEFDPDGSKAETSQSSSRNELGVYITACHASEDKQHHCDGTNPNEEEEQKHKQPNGDYAPSASQSACGEHTTTGVEPSSSPLGGEMRERERAVELLLSFRNSKDAEHHYLLDEFIAAFESPEIVLLDGSIHIDETSKCDDEDDEDVSEEDSSLSEEYHQTTSNWMYTHPRRILEPITEEEEDSEDGFHCSAILAPRTIPERADSNAYTAEKINQAGESEVLEASVKSTPERRPLRLQNGRTHGRTHLHKAPRPSNKTPRGGKENVAT